MGKMNKVQTRAKASKRRNIFTKINRTYWLIAFVIIGALCFMTYSIYDKYMDTLNWEKMDPSITMASQSLDLLYDKNPESKKNKIEFNKLIEKMMTSDGELTAEANKSNLKELKSYLKHIDTKSSEKDYEKMYAEVALKYSLQTQYNDLFEDEEQTILKKNVTPLTLAKLNESSFNDLTTLFIKNHNDKFVKNFLAKEKNLVSDVETFNKLIEEFDTAVEIKDKTITLKSGYRNNIQEIFKSTLQKLHLDWKSTDYMSNIVTMLNPVTEKMMSDYLSYSEYETDMANKEQVYYSWKLTKDEFFATVEAIHQQAIAEKRAREEAERIARELAAAKKTAKEYIGKLPTISSSVRNEFLSAIDNAQYIENVNAIVNQAQNAEAQAKQSIIDKENAEKEKEKEKETEKNKENDKVPNDDKNDSEKESTTDSSK